jgi:hypothetical protein
LKKGMASDWQELTKLTGSAPLIVERVRFPGSDIAIEGRFDLPPLARLSAEDQVFVIAFVRAHGSIKEMERTFGISYPTVKNRLNRISSNFNMVEVEPAPPLRTAGTGPDSNRAEILSQLESGEITADQAIGRLSQ